MAVTYSIEPDGPGWRVHSRGFVWHFALGADAVAFASDMAEQYARTCGQPTCVRFRDDHGDAHELRAFEGGLPWVAPVAVLAKVRQSTVVPFRRKSP